MTIGQQRFFDWTRENLPLDYPLTPFQQFTRNVDWKNSLVGPMDSWPHQLRQIVLLIIADPNPAAVWWGDDFSTMIYNEPYTHLIGNLHPALQGFDPRVPMGKAWDPFTEIMRGNRETGETHVGENQRVIYDRYGCLEEYYYSFKFIPMIGEEGYVVASYATVVETTREVISDRRSRFVRQLTQQMGKAEDLETFWPSLLDGLSKNDKDIPIALLYSTDDNMGKTARQPAKKPALCVLKGTLGIPEGHIAAPYVINIEGSRTGFIPAIRAALGSEEVVLLQTKDGSLEKDLLSDFKSRGYEAPCSQVIVYAIRSIDDILGFMILGLNPRKSFDADYQGFVDALTKQIIGPSYMSSIVLAEEVRRTHIDRALLSQQLEDALTMKRQQERFMDMISHEIRNPLSAILHCTEDIIASLNNCLSEMKAVELRSPQVPAPRIVRLVCNSKVFEEIIATAKTIVYCIQHQRRVVDDVLMLSKLDSDLLTVDPLPVQPMVMVQDALKMFESELRKAEIALDVLEDPSLHKLKADWVSLDPSRVLQILLNLCTNAIKFTRTEASKRIMVKVSASLEKPSEGYLPQRPRLISRQHADQGNALIKLRSSNNTSDDLYLSFSVTDSGKGMSPTEMKVLFQRFAQATPKTSSVYGGSGLGLFISRQIAEMLDGAIGVTSEVDKGSCFSFFVKTRRISEPCRKPSADSHVPPAIKVSLDCLASDTNVAVPVVESRAEAEDAASSAPPTVAQIIKVLVVEDNLINQKVVSTQLRKRGYKVQVANHGVEALAELKKTTSAGGNDQNFDVVLMDLEMPVMGGLECVQNIRKLEREGRLSGHVPVIAVTANARSLYVDAAMGSGMDGVTTKPYRMQDLVKQIEQAKDLRDRA